MTETQDAAIDVAARIASVAQTHGTRRAIVSNDACWTYAELDRRARAVAATLASHAVDSGGRVGVVASHGENAVCAILGVLYAGAVYVPLDPRWPIARRAQVAADADLSAVIVDGSDTSAHLMQRQLPVIELVAAQDTSGPSMPTECHGNAPAYILYTSGSTGTPKGVLQTRANLAAHADAYRTSISLTADDRVALVARISVDASVMDVFGALLTGACLYPFDPSSDRDIGRWLGTVGVTVLHGTPTLLRHVTGRCATSDLVTLRCVVSGGEELRAADAHALRGAVPHVLVVNGYGPSECTTALQYRGVAAELDTSSPVPMGSALPGVQFTVIRDDGENAAPGEVGELVLASPWLAAGYWRKPHLTAAAFHQRNGRRAYRTGDFVRRLADGSLAFVGRRDSLVKIRGLRVELGELESRLLRIPDVALAAVVVHRTPNGRNALAAYVTGIEPRHLDGVRASLVADMPLESVPASITALERMPLTDSGKIDRAALLPANSPPDSAIPSTTDAVLFEVIAQELDLANVCASDNFLAMGGDSLSAMACAAELDRLLGTSVPSVCFLETPELGHLASRLRALPRVGIAAPRPRVDVFPMTSPQLRYWERATAAEVPAALHVLLETTIDGPLDVGLLGAVVYDLPSRHRWLRTGFEMRDGRPVGVVHVSAALPLVVEERHSESFDPLDVHVPFDLASPPLVRATLVRRGPDRHVLRCLWHHLVVDAWSRRLFNREVYGEYAHRMRSLAPRETDPCRNFHGADEQRPVPLLELEEAKAWWTRTLGSATPLDPRALVGTGGVTRAVSVVGQAVADHLKSAAARQGVSKFALLLAITAVVIADGVGRERFVLTTDVSRRGARRDEIGLQTDVLVIALDLEGGREWKHVVRRVRRQTLNALAHSHVPFEWIVRTPLGGGLSTYDHVLPVAFFVEEPEPPRRFGDIVVTTREIPLHAPSRDLLLTVTDNGAGMEIEAVVRTGAPDRVQMLVDSIAAAMTAAAMALGGARNDPKQTPCRHS